MRAFVSRFPLRWSCYLAYFVGVSFQSGGIVHYPLDPSRYGRLIAIGALVFVVGAVASDLLEPGSRLRSSGPQGFASFVLSSLVLSLGVGMIGGSVQHFLDIPGRAPALIGLGLFLSAVGYHGRFKPHSHRTELVVGIAAVAVLAVPISLALRSYARSLPDAAPEHMHEVAPAPATSKRSDATTGTPPAAETAATVTSSPTAPTAPTAIEGSASDGSDDHHPGATAGDRAPATTAHQH